MWLYIPETSSPSAPASAGSSLGSPSLSTIGERLHAASATWRGKEQPPQAWSRRWKQGGFIRRLYGPTCSPSTLDLGVASFISSLRETPARTTVSPESERVPQESASSPPKSFVSPPSAGLILSSERTSRGTRADNSKLSSRHWSDWATALRQEYSARPKPETPCDASAGSSWPSATVGDASQTANRTAGRSDPDSDHHSGTTLTDAIRTWAAPQARDHFPAHSLERIAAMKAEGHGMRNLNDEVAQEWMAPMTADARGSPAVGKTELPNQAQNWAAPRTSDTNGSGDHGDGGMDLRTQVQKWSNPKASDPEKAGPNMRGSKGDVPLPSQAVQTCESLTWPAPAPAPAPATLDHKGSSASSLVRQDGKIRSDMLDYAAEQFFHPPSSPDQPIAGGSMSSTDGPNTNQPSAKRKLNPIFVEALMRWPTGLSGFERQETAWTPSSPHTPSSASPSAFEKWFAVQSRFLTALLHGQRQAGAEQMELFAA